MSRRFRRIVKGQLRRSVAEVVVHGAAEARFSPMGHRLTIPTAPSGPKRVSTYEMTRRLHGSANKPRAGHTFSHSAEDTTASLLADEVLFAVLTTASIL